MSKTLNIKVKNFYLWKQKKIIDNYLLCFAITTTEEASIALNAANKCL